MLSFLKTTLLTASEPAREPVCEDAVFFPLSGADIADTGTCTLPDGRGEVGRVRFFFADSCRPSYLRVQTADSIDIDMFMFHGKRPVLLTDTVVESE